MKYSEVLHSENDVVIGNAEQNESNFLQQARMRIAALKHMAEDVTEELGLSPEQKYDILAILVTPDEEEASSDAEADPDVEDILKEFDEYILTLARKNVFRQAVSPELRDIEVDELAQRVRIKLWHKLQRERVMSIKSYIRHIISSETIDMFRLKRAIFPLFLDADGELFQGQPLAGTGEETRDPAEMVEREENASQLMEMVVGALVGLPPRQRHAMICTLKDHVDDPSQLMSEFEKHGGNIDEITWPEKKQDIHSLKASLSIARKKLRNLPYIDFAVQSAGGYI